MSSCAARPASTSTATSTASATRRPRPSRRWPASSTCSRRPAAKLEHICKITIYLTDPRYREPVYNGSSASWLKGVYPVSTGLVVQALAKPEMVMEIDVDAVIPDDEA